MSRHVLLTLLPVLTASVARAQQSAPARGWTVTMTISTDFDNGSHANTVTMRQQLSDHRLRWQAARVTGPNGPLPVDSAYVIIDTADSTMTSVTPARHVATITSLNPLGAQAPAMKTVPHLTRNELEDLGDGGKILGHATRHFRLTTAGTMDITIADQTCTRQVDEVLETWIASDVDMGPMTAELSKDFGGGTSITDYSAQSGGTRPALPKGAALRIVRKQNNQNARGRVPSATTTFEIVELAETPLGPSAFSVPADIQTTDLRERMRQLSRATVDSAMKRGAAGMRSANGNCR